MRFSLLLLVVVPTLFSFVDAGKRCGYKIKGYKKCLKKGFVSNLGCDNADKSLKSKRKLKKCGNLEVEAQNCGYSCTTTVTCSKPDIAESTLQPGTDTINSGEAYTVTCGDGFTISGSPTVTCQADGQLSELPTCQPVVPVPLDLVSASQSSTGWGGDPMRGIDGNTDGNYWANSCTHSKGSTNNWWMATFAEHSAVNKVVIHNRVDCCSERINGAEVYVGDVYCGEVVYEAGKVIYEVECGNAAGGSVKVVQNDQPLTLCEVQVLGVPGRE